MDPAAALARRLEAVFRRIERERMADVPILNPALKVEVVGMRPWAGDWLCVLVTPWSMNLMLLPGDSGEGGWRAQAVGSSTRLAFPAGGFDFIVGAEPGIGCFAMCSLFSPMDGFGDAETAAATAAAALDEIARTAGDDADATAWNDLAAPPGARPSAPAPTLDRTPAPTRRELFGLGREGRS